MTTRAGTGLRWTVLLGLIGIGFATSIAALTPGQTRQAPPRSVRLYVFDCGSIKGLDPGLFGFKKGDLAETDFVVTCYLIAHPRGTLMWDVGVIPDSAFKPDGGPVTEGISTATKPLKPQLASAGYAPGDIS